jgi:uncharacterized protein YsxB (DUF464 family)
MRLTSEGVASRLGVSGHGMGTGNNGGDIVCPRASMSMSGETQTPQRLRIQKRASPRHGVIGHGMGTDINGGDIVCPMTSMSTSGETQSPLKRAKAKERSRLIKGKARPGDNDHVRGILDSRCETW